MKILALDTSASACSVALLIDDEIHLLHEIEPMQQAKRILPMIQQLITTHQVELNTLDALAFGCGPGSFTGVRIAASVIQGLAFATGVPLIKISSLAAVAQSAYQDLGWKKLLVAMDARIREVYWGIYQVDESGLAKLSGEEKVCLPQDISLPRGNDWYGVGSAWSEYKEALLATLPFELLGMDATRLPQASAVAVLAKDKFLRKEFTDPAEAIPVYLRDNVAIKEIKM
jgi:tRNA threonylcarbamoyladenosine biosynthesis protein TsaB